MKTLIIQIINIGHVRKGLNNWTIGIAGKTILSICRLYTAEYFFSYVSEIRELRLPRDSYEVCKGAYQQKHYQNSKHSYCIQLFRILKCNVYKNIQNTIRMSLYAFILPSHLRMVIVQFYADVCYRSINNNYD